MRDSSQKFVQFALERGALGFGEFVLKSGRKSPYFFNMGVLCTGEDYARLGHYYAEILREGAAFDVLFGPAYKGIPLATATACALADKGDSVGVAYNRKEAKDHGEGGVLVGAEIKGKRVVLLDDVITAGTAINQAEQEITQAGGELVAVVIAFNRQERGDGDLSAVEQVRKKLGGVPVISIATCDDMQDYLQASGRLDELKIIRQYREGHTS